MADGFINIPIETDSRTYSDAAVQQLKDQWPGWEPNEGDQEVVVLETVSPMAADVAQQAVRVPPAVFRTYGTKLAGLPYAAGSPATTTLTFTFSDSAGHTVQANTEVSVGGWAFRTDTDATAPQGSASITGVPATANVNGAGGNDLGPGADMVSSVAFVASVTATATANGTDPEDDLAYQDRLARELQLSAKTLVTARDYELMGLSQSGVTRIMAFPDPDARTVRVVATDVNGDPISASAKTSLAATYDELRLSNWVVSLMDPTYTTVSVTYTVKPYRGFETADIIDRINSVLTTWLAPNVWGKPKNFGDPGSAFGFNIEPTIRVNKLIDLIGDVDGVDYVDTLTISAADSAAGPRAGDVVLPGTVPLPKPGAMIGAIAA